jgi:Uma2 family endonuclease
MATVRKEITPQEYLAIERQAETKSEYLRGEMFAMSGASHAHTRIKDNLARHAANQLESGPCQVLKSDMRVNVNVTGLYTYPDVAIVCDKPQFEDEVFDTLLNPLIIVEVLSDSTERYDRGAKFDHYRQIPTLREYVLVAQNQPMIERYVLQPDGSWNLVTFKGLDKTFEFATVPVRIPMHQVYRNVQFKATTERTERPE